MVSAPRFGFITSFSTLAWLVWIGALIALTIWITIRLNRDNDPTAQLIFLPGPSTNGHHQIIQNCTACHNPVGGIDQNKCLTCHGTELEIAQDSHPRKKFTDPRNADRLQGLDALACITCHTEHQPGITSAMGVTLPVDYCYHCHADIGKERASHQGLPFSGCLSNGCHNYHDNRALNESFLAKHLSDKDFIENGTVPQRDFSQQWHQKHPQKTPLQQLLAVTDSVHQVDKTIIEDWHASGHAQAGVSCADCHQRSADSAEIPWTPKPNHTNCVRCHSHEVSGWQAGKHGMRTALNLSPMTPADARLSMRAEVAHANLNCSSCHSSHRYDTVSAAAESCLTCHADEHSLAWKKSPHAQAWMESNKKSLSTQQAGANCATCHMPRMRDDSDNARTFIEHNQNANLRPREAMVRSSCLHCHGLAFSLDALADDELVRRNFSGLPKQHVPSVDWVRAHQNETPSPSPSPSPSPTAVAPATAETSGVSP